MNAGSSLTKYAPWDGDNVYREVTHPEGLGYIATALGAKSPVEISHLRLRLNLGATDAQTSLTNNIKSFFKALKTYPYLKHLDIAYCQITDATCRDHLMPMLEVNEFIEELNVEGNAFTNIGVRCIFEAVALGRSKVSAINLSRNDYTYEAIEGVGPAVARDRFTKLDFSFSRLGAEGLKLLCPSMMKLTKLKTLNLESVQMGDEGCLYLSSLISKGGIEAVDVLNVAENHIGRIGIEKLSGNFIPGAGKNQTVTDLDVSRNYFGDEGVQFVIDMMQRNQTMKKLKLNRVGMTISKFNSFCEKLLVRYQQMLGPYPELELLEVGTNGLGNEIDTLTSMLQHPNCAISALNYEGNELTDFGVKKWKTFFTSFGGNRKDQNSEDVLDKTAYLAKETDTLFKEELKVYKNKRKNFYKLSLKSNAITGDGCEHLADIIKLNTTLNELDIRKNAIGVKGAIFFKKVFRKMQADIKNWGKTFKLHVLPADVTIEGLNHLAIGIRESPAVLKKWIKSKAQNPSHSYVRNEAVARSWALAFEKEEQKKRRYTDVKKEALNQLETERLLDNTHVERPNEVPSGVFHGAEYDTKFNEFNTPSVSATNKLDITAFKFGIEIYAENDEKENEWSKVTGCTYTSGGIVENNRGIKKWNPDLWDYVKKGWGCVVANTLYRYGVLIRLQYACESERYIEDLYLQRFGSISDYKLMRRMDSMETEELISKLVADDLRLLWEELMCQTCESSEGLTMFEFVLQNAKSPLIDVVRQFLNVFPSVAYGDKGSKFPAVFLQQTIAKSGKTYRDLCLESTDKFVKRYAEAKKLVLFRFLVVEPIYRSKFLKISKVEDLLLTEEFDDSDRFFYMRQIAQTSAQEDENLAKNEFEAHLSFCKSDGSYFGSGNTFIAIDSLILPNVNINLDVDFASMISQLNHKQQFLRDDRLMPTFTTIYKTTLKEVLDNQGLAAGRDLPRTQIMLRMVANSLDHFNCKDWLTASDFKFENSDFPDAKHQGLLNKPRIHGNLKPRNIVLRIADELPDLDKGLDLRPGKWVLSDFSRSTVHGETYFPVAHSAYNPPEVAKRIFSSEARLKLKIEANEKMDVWQFGCLLYEVLSGTTLFKMEARDDTILDLEERGELANWLSLDEDRASLILNQLKNYANDSYDEDEIKSIIASGRQLCEMCLQGNPDDRPTFREILNHPFLLEANVGKTTVEKDADAVFKGAKEFKIIPSTTTSWSKSHYLSNQPHMHLINTDFDQAGVIVKSLQDSLSKIGCRLTTDSIDFVQTADKMQSYEKDLKKNVESARVVACLLTRNAFYKPNVVKQVMYAEDYRKKFEKPNARVLFIDLGTAIDLSKDNLSWNKEDFREKWTMSDEFQYLVKALAEEGPSFSTFGLSNTQLDDKFDVWTKFLNEQMRGMILSYIQEPIKYDSNGFLFGPMLDRMLTDGKLIPISKMKKYSAPSLGQSNYIDPTDILVKKLAPRKDKFLDLYFLPAHRVKKGDVRVYVLSGPSSADEIFLAVSNIAQALESPNGVNSVSDDNRHKDAINPKNKLFNKVKTSYNIKKESHLKTGGRTTVVQVVKDSVMNITRESGDLVIVLLCTPGVFERYTKFLHDAVSKREKKDLILLLFQGPGFKCTDDEAKKEIKSFCPKELHDQVLNKDNYLPFFKPKKDPWQYEATMEQLVKIATYKLDHPTPKNSFNEVTA